MKVKNLVFYAMGMSLTLLLTWAFSIPVLKGYINLGDVGVLLSGMILGPIGGMVAGAVGSSLADILLGYAFYAPFTFVIKGIEGFVAGKLNPSLSKKSPIFTCVIASALMVFGYFLSELFLYDLGGALASIPGNAIQAIVCSILATLIYTTLEKTGVVTEVKRIIA